MSESLEKPMAASEHRDSVNRARTLLLLHRHSRHAGHETEDESIRQMLADLVRLARDRGCDFSEALESAYEQVDDGIPPRFINVVDMPSYKSGFLPPGEYEVSLMIHSQDTVIVRADKRIAPNHLVGKARKQWKTDLREGNGSVDRYIIKPL